MYWKDHVTPRLPLKPVVYEKNNQRSCSSPRFHDFRPIRARDRLLNLRSCVRASLASVVPFGNVSQELADEAIDRGVTLGRVAANRCENVLVHTEGDVLHIRNLCVTV